MGRKPYENQSRTQSDALSDCFVLCVCVCGHPPPKRARPARPKYICPNNHATMFVVCFRCCVCIVICVPETARVLSLYTCSQYSPMRIIIIIVINSYITTIIYVSTRERVQIGLRHARNLTPCYHSAYCATVKHNSKYMHAHFRAKTFHNINRIHINASNIARVRIN